MARFSRILVTDKSSPKATSAAAAVAVAAPPPEAVALESDFVIILAVLLCALICVVGLIAAARCAWRRRSSGGTSANRYPSPPASANKGVKKKVLQSLPKFTYTARETTASQENTNSRGPNVKLASPLTAECAICLGEFVEGDEIRVLPQCGHGFHVACIDKWLGSHSTCPSCRQILVVGRCQKCGQFPAVSLAEAAAGTSAGSEPEPRQLNNNTEDRLSTTTTSNNSNAFLP